MLCECLIILLEMKVDIFSGKLGFGVVRGVVAMAGRKRDGFAVLQIYCL